ncbi:hypothetical protein [Streptomyces sp. NPDC059949]|uniref:hypothetical protein n=1 Tax=Streptomyces sp. NPDC059949 TaxID=3347013 RepID=UPI00364E9DF9
MKISSLPRGNLWLRASLALTRLLITWRIPIPGLADIGPFATFGALAQQPASTSTSPRRPPTRRTPPHAGAVRPLPPARAHRRC